MPQAVNHEPLYLRRLDSGLVHVLEAVRVDMAGLSRGGENVAANARDRC